MAKERLSGKAEGETIEIMPSKAPAKPATPALTVNARTFRRPTLSPTREAAAGFDLPAFHALPYLLFRMF